MDTGEILASDLTARRTHNSSRVPALLEQIADPVASVSADGAYDTKAVYEAAHERGEGRAVRVLIPPGRDARLNPRPSAAQKERNRNIRSIRELGRREWHTSSGYSKRSMVENTMYRYKTLIGRSMRSRTLDGQRVEVHLASKVLNTMTLLGMPDSYKCGGSPAWGTGDLSSVWSHAPKPFVEFIFIRRVWRDRRQLDSTLAGTQLSGCRPPNRRARVRGLHGPRIHSHT